jgi:hypothetical protein
VDPCLSNPCAPDLSVCVRLSTESIDFNCECINDAHGIPGVDGSGCVQSSLASSNGSITFTVADTLDVNFQIGVLGRYSVRGLDERIEHIYAPSGVIDSTISSGVASLSAATSTKLQAVNAGSVSSIQASLSAQLSTTSLIATSNNIVESNSCGVAASADLTAKTSATLSSANANANSYVSANSVQLAVSLQSGDSTTKSSNIAYTDAMRVSVSTQLSGES